jgi:hypothetical protein
MEQMNIVDAWDGIVIFKGQRDGGFAMDIVQFLQMLLVPGMMGTQRGG